MSRNRKREQAIVRFLPVVKGLLVCCAVATVGFGYIWQKNSIYKLGDDIKYGEQQLEALRKKNEVLVDQVTRLKSPRVLEAKCKSWNLGLCVPGETQIVRVPDPAPPSAHVSGLDNQQFDSRYQSREIAANLASHGWEVSRN